MVTYTDDVLVVGDGPTGLTTALFLAKNGMSVRVLGQDKTGMHKALLHNQPGAPDVPGSEFMDTLRAQADEFGARLHNARATSAERDGDAFVARTEEGDTFRARYLVLATGRNTELAEKLGLEEADRAVRIDIHGRTSADRVYAGGNLARGYTQAAISAGDGAAIAISILSREKGKAFHDYDVVRAPSQQRARQA